MTFLWRMSVTWAKRQTCRKIVGKCREVPSNFGSVVTSLPLHGVALGPSPNFLACPPEKCCDIFLRICLFIMAGISCECLVVPLSQETKHEESSKIRANKFANSKYSVRFCSAVLSDLQDRGHGRQNLMGGIRRVCGDQFLLTSRRYSLGTTHVTGPSLRTGSQWRSLLRLTMAAGCVVDVQRPSHSSENLYLFNSDAAPLLALSALASQFLSTKQIRQNHGGSCRIMALKVPSDRLARHRAPFPKQFKYVKCSSKAGLGHSGGPK